MPEPALNSDPLNRACKPLLAQLQLVPHPGSPFALQLALWGLENLQAEGQWRQFQDDLLQHAQVMLVWEPQLVLRHLLDPVDPGSEDAKVPLQDRASALAGSFKGLSPQESSSRLVENLYDNLAQYQPALQVPSQFP